MNSDSTASPTLVTIEVQYRDCPDDKIALHRWQIYHRLCELEISCHCQAYQPLTIQVNSAIAACQLWSVLSQVSMSRSERIDWLERCWQLR